MLHIYVDADACPVKDEIYRVAGRLGLDVTVVANSWMRVPNASSIELVVVKDGLDAADDWIADHVKARDIVITADIPLANRCVKAGAEVLGPTGRQLTEESIGEAVAIRDLLTDLRSGGEMTGGPLPFRKRDRSRFLQQLDEIVRSIRRESSM